MDEQVNCGFCSIPLDPPVGDDALDQVLTCPGCGARYWLEGADDLCEVPHIAAELFDIPEEEAGQRVEHEVTRDFDRLLAFPEQPADEGQELCLVFVRLKQ